MEVGDNVPGYTPFLALASLWMDECGGDGGDSFHSNAVGSG